MFLSNFYALISSVEWLDFYTDSEGLSMSLISRSLLLLWNLSFMYADCVVFVTFCKNKYGTTNEWCSRSVMRYLGLLVETYSVLTYNTLINIIKFCCV